jgi:hypothetical protein
MSKCNQNLFFKGSSSPFTLGQGCCYEHPCQSRIPGLRPWTLCARTIVPAGTKPCPEPDEGSRIWPDIMSLPAKNPA